MIFALVCGVLALGTPGDPILGPGMAGPPMPLGSGFVPKIEARRVPKNSRDVVERLNRVPDLRTERGGDRSVLVLYDGGKATGWVGALYAQQLANLLGHFSVEVVRVPIEAYRAGLIGRFRATFYLGIDYNHALPTDFLHDVATATRPVAWLGLNLWQVAGQGAAADPAFLARTGVRFINLDGRGFPTVAYKGVNLSKSTLDPTLARTEIASADLAKSVAQATGPSGEMPYIVRGGHKFWFVADNPFSCVDGYRWNDRVLAFADVLHDILELDHASEKLAVVRVEDVRPIEDATKIRLVADTCAEEHVPFGLSVIPRYEDPLNAWPNGPRTATLADTPAFTDLLKYVVDRGATLLLHGATHQFGKEKNPYSGVSAQDFEFMRVVMGPDGTSTVWEGPIPGDSPRWARRRVEDARADLTAAGFRVNGWVTPHYAASPVDYVEFARVFSFSLCRPMTFSLGEDGSLYMLQQMLPYPSVDVFGMPRLPETLGYIEPSRANGFAAGGYELADRAQALAVVRDGWAGFFFHPFIDAIELRAAVQAMKANGFRFVAPAAPKL